MKDEKWKNNDHNGLTRREFLKNTGYVLGGVTLSSLAFLNACKSGTSPKQAGTTTAAGTSRPHPQARTGDINTGAKIEAVTQSVDSSGGYIAVSKAGDPLDGFVINLPENSYPDSSNFKVSYAPITNHTFGSDITPISPMIYVDNGGDFSSQLMYVRVPVTVPDGSFAMGFIYDATTKQLEGMPLVAVDADSVTVGTSHFTDFFISMISKALLKDDIDSGFRPGIDDWQFTNYGSVVTYGNCEGQSLSALWYYCTQPDGKDIYLYGRYDNNGNQPATPDLWQDDSLGYRFCSVVQLDLAGSIGDMFWLNLSGKDWVWATNHWKLVDVPAVIDDEMKQFLFAYSIQATGEPQLVSVKSKSGGGHSIICYRVNQGSLYIADPNYPGPASISRRIEYADGKFSPYHSGDNATVINAGGETVYETINYTAKSTVLPWGKLNQRWAEFKNHTIGNIGYVHFPAYALSYLDDNKVFQDLKDGYVSTTNKIWIKAFWDASHSDGVDIYRDGVLLPKDSNYQIELQTGDNKLGIYIQKQAVFNNESTYRYVDFQYINVIYNATTTAPAGGQSISVSGLKTNSNLPQGAFGTPDNPYEVDISGKLKGDPNLKFEGVEYYDQFGAWLHVMAFVWSIPKPTAVSTTGTTTAALIQNLGADGLSIKFNNPKETQIISGDKTTGEITTTWQGWANGWAIMTGSVYQWSNGGSVTRNIIAQRDTQRNGEGENSISASGDTTAFQLNAKISVSTASGDTTYNATETVVIRLVQR